MESTDVAFFKKAMDAINDGMWITSEQIPGLMSVSVKVRGFSSRVVRSYIDAEVRAGQKRMDASSAALRDLCLIDVKGLTSNGEAVSVETVRENLLDDAWEPFAILVTQAANYVDNIRERHQKKAEKI